TRPFLRRADHAVDFGRLDGVPLAGAQTVGRRMLRDCEKNHRGEYARPPVMNACQNHSVDRL
ncbi:MAG TPA: hypothetical protein VF237_10955, partial [Xanthobacteraceae bacterium]